MSTVFIVLSLLSLAESLSLLPRTAIQSHINGHFWSFYASVRLQRGPTVVLCTTIDESQRQCPRGTAQLLSATLGDAGGTAGQQEVLLLQGFLQVQRFELNGHVVDSSTVEDLSDFSTGILIVCALLMFDVQGGNDLPTYQFPDVYFMHTANPRHSRQLVHYNRQE